MSFLTITTNVSNVVATIIRQAKQPSVTIRSLSGKSVISLKYAPQGWTSTGEGPVYVRTPRPGRPDDVDRQYEETPVFTLELTLAEPDYYETSAQAQVTALRRMARLVEPVVLGDFGGVVGPFYISALSFNITDVMPGTNEPARGTATVEFTKLDVKIPTGPVSGGASNPLTPDKIPSTYTVKDGDTLSGIALKVLGDAAKWRQLAQLNGLRDPRKLKTGMVLKMPKQS